MDLRCRQQFVYAEFFRQSMVTIRAAAHSAPHLLSSPLPLLLALTLKLYLKLLALAFRF